jgi:PIN domain nuclease of toxin-antitoxin system
VALKHVIDTHTLLWFLGKNPRLGSQARSILRDDYSSLILPAIALAESYWIVEKQRTSVTVSAILSAIDEDPRIEVYSLTRAVVERCNLLTAISEMHDRQIVATALALQDEGHMVIVVTKDLNIIESKLITTVW